MMSTHTIPTRIRRGSPQQEAFWAQLPRTENHVLLEARAGTGKSSTCREAMWRLLENDSPAIRYCCFNKSIAQEFQAGCPEEVEVGTMHSFGYRALGRAFGSKLDQFKTYNSLDSMEYGADLPRYLRKSISTLVGLAKNHALGADWSPGALLDLVLHYDVPTWRRESDVLHWAAAVLEASAKNTAVVDFDDMLWLCVVHKVQFPKVDYLFIDECQDLNPVQHAMVPLMARGGRTVIVGDPYQSIYAFRGADSESIPNLRRRLDAEVMPLTVSWRCPRRHVALASELVPDFEAAPNAAEGILDHGREDDAGLAGSGSLVLCRINAPLISLCLQVIAQHRPAVVRGRGLGDQLKTVLAKMNVSTTSCLVREIDRWRSREIERLSRKDGTDRLIETVIDKADCLTTIAESCGSPAEVPDLIDRLFADNNDADRVTFSTVHRAKGSEAQNVYYLRIPYSQKRDAEKPPPQWELDQRRNLNYVALTRSKNSLTLLRPNEIR